MSYSARCPSCSSPVTGALFSDPNVPIYACGWYGSSRAECSMRPARDPGNLERLTRDESRDLLDLFDFAALTIIRSVG